MLLSNVNSSGQGYTEEHTANPHHVTLVNNGWVYSHTTPIHFMGLNRLDLVYYLHTYKSNIDANWVCGVNVRPGNKVDFHKLGSSRNYSCFGSQVAKYLKRKNAELRRKFKIVT